MLALDSLGARFIGTRLFLTARVPHVDAGVLADHWHARATVSATAAHFCPSVAQNVVPA